MVDGTRDTWREYAIAAGMLALLFAAPFIADWLAGLALPVWAGVALICAAPAAPALWLITRGRDW